MLPGCRDLARRSVVQAAVRPVVVVVDVAGDLLARLGERLELVAPDAPEFQL
jgi:hypothetical protein